ncbi:uncharacterized protein [Malus domestica]|uniref:uncharacterized protein isoform X2 n=1 Tax=Malus domestica TaxID=3750 RepID=UPI00397694E8
MKERSKEMGSSRRTAEEIFRDYSGRRTDAVHALTNEREVEQGFVRFGQLGLPPTSVLENVVFDDHNREIDYSEKSVTGRD